MYSASEEIHGRLTFFNARLFLTNLSVWVQKHLRNANSNRKRHIRINLRVNSMLQEFAMRFPLEEPRLVRRSHAAGGYDVVSAARVGFQLLLVTDFRMRELVAAIRAFSFRWESARESHQWSRDPDQA